MDISPRSAAGYQSEGISNKFENMSWSRYPKIYKIWQENYKQNIHWHFIIWVKIAWCTKKPSVFKKKHISGYWKI